MEKEGQGNQQGYTKKSENKVHEAGIASCTLKPFTLCNFKFHEKKKKILLKKQYTFCAHHFHICCPGKVTTANLCGGHARWPHEEAVK